MGIECIQIPYSIKYIHWMYLDPLHNALYFQFFLSIVVVHLPCSMKKKYTQIPSTYYSIIPSHAMLSSGLLCFVILVIWIAHSPNPGYMEIFGHVSWSNDINNLLYRYILQYYQWLVHFFIKYNELPSPMSC